MIARGVVVVLGVAVASVLLACGDGGQNERPRASGDLPSDPEALMAVALRTTFVDITATVESDPDPSAVIAMGESGDQRYIPVLIDVLGFPWLLDADVERAIYDALSGLSGVEVTDETTDWTWWVEWLSRETDIAPPPGYARWKGNLYTQYVDPRIGSLLVAADPARIRLEEVAWGGVLRDGIPDLQDAPVIPAAEATYLLADDRVFGVVADGEARAYPLRIMNAHEMANDTIAGTRIALAYCTLCGSAVAYIADVGGETYSFGTSGLLYRGNKLMYDRETQSLWLQFQGEPVIGTLRVEGITLGRLPVTLTTWADWTALHPDTTVLDIDTGIYPVARYVSESDPASAYYEYRGNDGPIFPVHERSGLLPDKELVAGVVIEGDSVAYPLDVVDRLGVINGGAGGVDLVVIGDGARVYERRGIEFVANAATEPGYVTDSQGGLWRVNEDALASVVDSSDIFPRVQSQVAYWFAWFQFYPLTEVYDG